jgi:hypothetical protein
MCFTESHTPDYITANRNTHDGCTRKERNGIICMTEIWKLGVIGAGFKTDRCPLPSLHS